MNGTKTQMLGLMNSSNNRFVIPLYQRKYSWEQAQCKQLMNDLRRLMDNPGRRSHFFGSLVADVHHQGMMNYYHMVDGQQRLTTVCLLLTVIRDLTRQGLVPSQRPHLAEEINNTYLVAPYDESSERIKLRPGDDDRAPYRNLVNADPIAQGQAQNKLMQNYCYLRQAITDGGWDVDALFAALGKLEVIFITLDAGDDAQEIFESLNSTGLALSEGDKIRNYVFMGFSPDSQDRLYQRYWTDIDRLTANHLSDFVRDYLSIKQLAQPNKAYVYAEFKTYARGLNKGVDALLCDLHHYATLYHRLLTFDSGLSDPKMHRKADACLRRIGKLKATPVRPYLMAVMHLQSEGTLNEADTLLTLLTIECFLLRRTVCKVPASALTKIFIHLNDEVMRLDLPSASYPQKLAYLLRRRSGSSRLPDDHEFTTCLSTINLYKGFNADHRAYLFERLENEDSLETKPVYERLADGTYTIEHIMPQNLSAEWTSYLGPEAQTIHQTWVHRLANLTLSAYNARLSNRLFAQKRDDPVGGYAHSGLRMTLRLAHENDWGPEQLQRRNDELAQTALHLWPLPSTGGFVPARRSVEEHALSDADMDYTGRRLVAYRYLGVEHPSTTMAWMFKDMMQVLYQLKPDALIALAQNPSHYRPASSFRTTKHELRRSHQIADGLYVEMNNSAQSITSLLRMTFIACGVDPAGLTIILQG